MRTMRVMHYDAFNAKLCVILCTKNKHFRVQRYTKSFFHHFEQFQEIMQLCARTIFIFLRIAKYLKESFRSKFHFFFGLKNIFN